MLTHIDLQLFAEPAASNAQAGTDTGSKTDTATPAATGGKTDTGSEQQPGKTFTQEELERIINERLERERKKYADYAELKKAADELKKLKESQMSEAEKLAAKVAEYERRVIEAERQAAEAKLEAAKLKALDELNLPRAWAERLFGTTEEELRTDAKALAKLLGETKGKSVGSGSNPGPGTAPDVVELARKRAQERNQKPKPQGYDPWAIRV